MPAVTQYTTENSIYEVCQEVNMARRITGKAEPTPYTESGGKWKRYISCYPTELGESKILVIVWHVNAATITSLIKDERHFVEEQTCPECKQNKHTNCDGTTWDEVRDEPMLCQCLVEEHVYKEVA
jgi:hypothetical protein